MGTLEGISEIVGRAGATGVMGEDLVFSTASRCFWRIDAAEWAEITSPDNWHAFLDGLVCLGAAGADGLGPALVTPPDYDGFIHAQRHFVGGLPDSAVPVESLYAPRDQLVGIDSAPGQGFWMQQPALYMRDLITRLGMAVPEQFRDCPDHLALELDVAASLVACGAKAQADDFIIHRLAWLPKWRSRVAAIAPEGATTPPDLAFHAALGDALINIVASRGNQAAGGDT